MKLSAYNVLSSLLHGFVLLYVIFRIFDIAIENNAILFYTAIAYILGFFINALGSWLEPLYFLCWGGKPSNKLLDKAQGRFIFGRLYQVDIIKTRLIKDAGNYTHINSDCLFSIAQRKAGETNRISDLNGMYAFSRGLITMSFILSGLFISRFYACWWCYIICAVTIIIVNIRCCQFAYYYAKEVYTTYLTIQEPQSKIKSIR